MACIPKEAVLRMTRLIGDAEKAECKIEKLRSITSKLDEKEIEVEMRAELYEFLLENKFKNGIMFKRSMELFVEHYNMEGTVEEDSLMRAFKRWRKAMKDNRKY